MVRKNLVYYLLVVALFVLFVAPLNVFAAKVELALDMANYSVHFFDATAGDGDPAIEAAEFVDDGGKTVYHLPEDSNVQYNGKNSLRVNHLRESSWFNASFKFSEELLDLTEYEGYYLQFAVKGENGGETLNLGIRSEGEKDSMKEIVATKDWKIMQFSVDELIAGNDELNPEGAWIIVEGSNRGPQKMWLADFSLTDEKVTVEDEKPADGDKKDTTPKTGDFGALPYLGIALVSGVSFIAMKKRKSA